MIKSKHFTINRDAWQDELRSKIRLIFYSFYFPSAVVAIYGYRRNKYSPLLAMVSAAAREEMSSSA